MCIRDSVPGMHNVSNALAGIALSLDLGISTDAILAGLSAFGGADLSLIHILAFYEIIHVIQCSI